MIGQNAAMAPEGDAWTALILTLRTKKKKWNGCVSMVLMLNVCIVLINNSYQKSPIFRLINFFKTKNWSVKEFIQQMLNAETVYLLLN